ncbi:MAG: hypothetical protein ABSF69_24280 [Polyangiaceae bacterium]
MSWTHANKRSLVRALLAGALVSGAAHAQSPQRDPALAETLFQEAKGFMTSGDYASACPKLAESYRLDPGTGTLTALATCHEQLGKNATAWAEFIELVSEAQRTGRADREKFARQHAATLEPGLSRLTITVAPETAALANVEVRRDKVVVGSAAWGVASPVDPGDHVIEATAPGKQSWSSHVNVGASGDNESVTVPKLEDASESTSGEATPPMIGRTAEPKEPAEEPPPPLRSGNGQRAAGVVVGVAGLASLGIGSVFGLEAVSKSNDAKQQCPMSMCPAAAAGAIQENNTAKTDALVADVTLGAGLVAVGVGAYLLFSAPSGAKTVPAADSAAEDRLRLVPLVGRGSAGLAVWAGF